MPPWSFGPFADLEALRAAEGVPVSRFARRPGIPERTYRRRLTRLRGRLFKTAFAGPDPLLRHVRTRVRSPQTAGVVERFFDTLKDEHICRGVIADGDALETEVHRFRILYNTVRPHEALDDRTPNTAYTS